jgi:uncharacterized membrane protein (UPF0127 family)
MRARLSVFSAALAIVVGLFANPATARAQTLDNLDFQTAGDTRHFQIELTPTQADRERGLMFRRFLPADRGMLFQFPVEEKIYMWMKNTYVPLDMIFVDRGNKVVKIERNTEPLSERIISSGVPASAVLEINGGAAEKLGIQPGDTMIYPVPH